jgi:hypothetical protein
MPMEHTHQSVDLQSLICKAYSGLNLIADRIYKPNMDF